MSTQNIRTFLRIVAVLTILVGGIGLSTAMVESIAINQMLNTEGMNVQHSVTSAGFYGVLSWLAVLGWGAALYHLSHAIARHITSEPAEPSKAPLRGEPRRS